MNEHLKQILKQEDTILFIGSGVSCWSGLPSWSGLLNQLADFLQSSNRDGELVRKESKQDLLQAASYGFDQLTPGEIGDFIRKACQFGKAVPHEIHRKIVTLGPRCFITTNYDQLIEDSLRKWQHGRPVRPVTNKQPFEEADIIQTRTLDFIFKPHGDVGDVESIVLTREQYRKLLEGGEWRHALESLKTLLVTRRVVYLGFGLRDPDFLLLRDILANTWKGGTREHYAIMADVGAGEIGYWRKNYGIHLIAYPTVEAIDGKRNHSALLALLDEFLQPATAAVVANSAVPSELILSLLRYANGLMRFDAATLELPLRVRSAKGWRYARSVPLSFDRWDHSPVRAFLEDGPQRAVLLGLPGAGKTYSLRQATARLAQSLHDSCLEQPLKTDQVIIPMIADMKLYAGDLVAMLETSLPTGVLFADLTSQFQVKVFVDSFNEMPRDCWDRGAHETDFASFLEKFPDVNLVIGSRTDDGLAKLDFPNYSLDEIDYEFLENQLKELGMALEGPFAHELRELLRKPFYFQLVAKRSIKLPEQPHPRDLYRSFFNELSISFEKHFGISLNLEKSLAPAAYEAINRGEEALPVSIVYQALRNEMQSVGIIETTPEAAAAWLVTKSVLLPYSGGRVALFHQSVTEFLAAHELAERFRASPVMLKEKLSLNRWDQAIFLTLGLLSEQEATTFLNAVISADFSLALRATKYLEINRESIVARLLSEIPARIADTGELDFYIESALDFHVPATEDHETQLRSIMDCGNMVGGTAAAKLLYIKGKSLKDEMLNSLLERRADYNYCSRLGGALASFLGREDLDRVALMADSIENEVTDDDEDAATHGFLDGVGQALSQIGLTLIVESLFPQGYTGRCQKARTRIILECLGNTHTSEALELAADLLLNGIKEAATKIYFIARFSDEDTPLSWHAFSEKHVAKLIQLIAGQKPDEKDTEPWALRALRHVCRARQDLVKVVETKAGAESGLRRAALFHALGVGYTDHVLAALNAFATMPPEERKQEPGFLLSHMGLDWTGHEELFVRLLRLRDTEFARHLLEPVATDLTGAPIGNLEIGEIGWWLDWFIEKNDPDAHWWFCDRLGRLFAQRLTREAHDALLAEFNRKDSKYRTVLARFILNNRNDLTTNDFSEDALSFLLSDLSDGANLHCHELLLGRTATETFVTDRLLPLVANAAGTLRSNLISVLKQAGKRHGRRYIST